MGKKRVLSTITELTLLSLALSLSPFQNEALAKSKSSDADWLKPGFEAVIMPATDSGQSITVRMDSEGLVLCASTQDPSNGVIPAPTHCNYRITPAGFHVPAESIFVSDKGVIGAIWEKMKEVGKVVLAAAPLGLEAFDVGATSEAAQAASNIVSPDPMDMLKASYDVSKTMDTVAHYGAQTQAKGEGMIPVGTIPYAFADILQAVEQSVDKYVKSCANAPDQRGNVCYEQKRDETYAINIMSVCDIANVNANAGEPGSAELWFPDEPLPQGCSDQLQAAGQSELLQWALTQEPAPTPSASPSPDVSPAPETSPSLEVSQAPASAKS